MHASDPLAGRLLHEQTIQWVLPVVQNLARFGGGRLHECAEPALVFHLQAQWQDGGEQADRLLVCDVCSVVYRQANDDVDCVRDFCEVGCQQEDRRLCR
ncbi:hypothetical protein GALL_427070 [mine drainage metagenome]|uniref:Uncharacterized protein n=1 Tax=mine drainage metagenome TaxID=410659 RepID=A0A1J5PXJ6_9ZZZZ